MARGHWRQVFVVNDLDFFHHRWTGPKEVAELDALVTTGKNAAVNLGAGLKASTWPVELVNGPVALFNAFA